MEFDELNAKVEYESVPEMWILLISLAGGFAGVVLGTFAFRHKTSFQLKIATAAVSRALTLVFLAMGRQTSPGMHSID